MPITLTIAYWALAPLFVAVIVGGAWALWWLWPPNIKRRRSKQNHSSNPNE